MALGVGMAALFQASSKTAQPLVMNEAVEKLRADPLYAEAMRASLEQPRMLLEGADLERRPAEVYSSGRAPVQRADE
mgnify:CR=1 FL=1